MEWAKPFLALVTALQRLPGVGQKTAQRLALHVMKAPRPEIEALARALIDVRDKMKPCSTCFSLTEDDPCALCTGSSRDRRTLMVVEEASNVMQMERSHFRGIYHVLNGTLSPLRGVGPEQLGLEALMSRLQGSEVEEVILATNPTSEGEATAHYLLRLLKPLGLRVSRIAFGLPVGSDLEYADEVTLGRALEGRRDM